MPLLQALAGTGTISVDGSCACSGGCTHCDSTCGNADASWCDANRHGWDARCDRTC